MKFLRDLLFSQHYELKRKERPLKSAKTTGLIMVTVVLLLSAVALFMVLYASGALNFFDTDFSGRTAGRLAGILLFAVVFGLVYLVFGKEEKYQNLISEYEKLPDSEQELIYKKSMRNLVISFFLLMMIICIAGVMV